jgi:hypothetical protein
MVARSYYGNAMWLLMSTNSKYRVAESFGDFIGATEVLQKGNSVQPAQFGANPEIDDDQLKLPFEFERSPEIGERANDVTLMLEKIQAIADAGINKSNNVGEISPYIDRQFQLAYKHLREGYLRLMDMK